MGKKFEAAKKQVPEHPLTIEDAIATDTRGSLVERGETRAARMLTTPYFVQMKGRARLSGVVDGQPLRGEGEGFFETYR